ncbi:hypothetical protein HBH98_030500 [Parastagonospora nodorum]|nr:hypothetical protein HBH43_121060 [Parastagonospora nodorum]KAH4351521.1 hypothetical protein HBH98_030500 [Parastagonospora nodorum]KAH4395984.1 hypothetical protein HBH97_015080 [Parastagonospora nodorum]KAH4427127.1 hypothetical protein HBH99_019410 [Parastagonospora nodorum]KAH4908214.1 hypothetical protein HBI80_060500 [Parastagonospora nodorum]
MPEEILGPEPGCSASQSTMEPNYMLCCPLWSIWPTHSWIKLNLFSESLDYGLPAQAHSARQTAALFCQQLIGLREWAHELRALGQMRARMQLVCTKWRFSWRQVLRSRL